MKLDGRLRLLIALTGAFCGSLQCSQVVAQEPIVWRMAVARVPGSSYQMIIDALPERLSRATNSQLKVEFVTPSFGPTEYVAAVRDGRLDAISILTSSYRSELPILTIGTLPGLFRSIEQYKTATDQVLFGVFRDILRDKYGLVYAAGGSLPGAILFSRQPIVTANDIAGKRIRPIDSIAAQHLAALRATPATMPGGEVMAALQRGVVDASETGPGPTQLEFAKVSKYAVHWPGRPIVPWAIIVDLKVWNRLRSETQTTVTREFGKLQAEGFDAAIKEARAVPEALKRIADVTLVSLPPAESAKILDPKLVEPIYKEWAQLNRKQGIEAEGILARVQLAKGTGGGGDPCYYPTCKCTDGTCKTECCRP